MSAEETEQLGLYAYAAQRKALGERTAHYFALKTGGRMHFSRDNGLMYVQYPRSEERGQLILWVIPPVDHLLDSAAVRSRFERQRRSIVDRGRKGLPIGHHGLLTLPPGECEMTPGCLESAKIALRGDDILYVNGKWDAEGKQEFDDFVERIFSQTPEQMFERLRDGYLIV